MMPQAWGSSLVTDDIQSIINSSDPVQAYLSNYQATTDDDCELNWPSSVTSGCWSLCDDPEAVFNDYVSMFECALYSHLTNSFRSGALNKKNGSYMVTDHVDTSITKAANVTSIISTCLTGYCAGIDDCANDVCSPSALSANGSVLNLKAMESCSQMICDGRSAPLANTDFAGIGILISYMSQVAIALLSGVILTVLAASPIIRKWLKTTRKAIAKKVGATSADNEDQYYEFGFGNKQKPSRTQQFYDALLAALVEFFKAQCFVAMASSIAALIVFKSQDTGSFLDRTALMTTSSVGILPVTFTLYILATFNYTRKSWYLYFLSLCTWILAFYAAFSLQIASNADKRNGDNDIFRDTYSEFPDACGNLPPYYICPYVFLPDLHAVNAFYNALCLPIIFGLTIWQLSSIPRVSTFLASVPLHRLGKYPLLLLAMLHLGALGLFTMPLYYFFKGIWSLFQTQSVGMTWNFGQVVAITAWIPTIAALVNNYVDGVGAAHTKQLPPTYRTVTMRNSSTFESEHHLTAYNPK